MVTPEPKKRPKSSYIRLEALDAERVLAGRLHLYRLTRPDGRPGLDSEVLSWLDDCSRFALRLTAHHRVTGTIVLTEFRRTVATHGIPASTLTDNGMVFTTRLSGGKGGRTGRCPTRATPATIYTSRPKATPSDRTDDRIRHDRVDKSGKITLRHERTLYSIGIGRTHARTRVIVLVQDLGIRIIDAVTGELLRELVLDTAQRYQGTGRPPGPNR